MLVRTVVTSGGGGGGDSVPYNVREVDCVTVQGAEARQALLTFSQRTSSVPRRTQLSVITGLSPPRAWS
jgi:hypothetical protein